MGYRCAGPAARHHSCRRVALRRIPRSFLLLQEFAEERVIELISASSRPDQKAFLRETCEIFCLKLACEVMRLKLTITEAGELVNQFEFFCAELQHIRAEFLTAQLVEYCGPKRVEVLELNLLPRGINVLAYESNKVRMPGCLFLKPGG